MFTFATTKKIKKLLCMMMKYLFFCAIVNQPIERRRISYGEFYFKNKPHRKIQVIFYGSKHGILLNNT